MANLGIKVETVLRRFYDVRQDKEIRGLYEVREKEEPDSEMLWYFFSSNNATYHSSADDCVIRDINQSNSGYLDRLKSAFEKARERDKKIFWLVLVFGEGIGLAPGGYDWLASVELRVGFDDITASLAMRKYPVGKGRKGYFGPCCVRVEQNKYFNTTFLSCKDENGAFTSAYMDDYFRLYDNRPYRDVMRGTCILNGELTEKADTPEELGGLLYRMYRDAAGGNTQAASIYLFGIRYGEVILQKGYQASVLIGMAGLKSSYVSELQKALDLYRCLKQNKYGISVVEETAENLAYAEREGGYAGTVFAEAGTAKQVSAERQMARDRGPRRTGAENILLYGVPGSGKSHEIRTNYCADAAYMERVVFHPDYTYSDFVGQILPRVEGGGESGRLRYVFTPGPFTTMLKKAEEDPSHYYYLVIEELNRGNAPAIFGEIFQLLDRKEEGEAPPEEVGESEYGISNYDIAKEVYRDETHPVKIPSNLYVLATMNTADQNVFTLDTAFQRRWNMKQMANRFDLSEHAKNGIEGTKINWGAFATVINEMVSASGAELTGSEDKRLGVYFARRKELKADRFPQKVLKYLWDDVFLMDRRSVFREECNCLDDVVMAYGAAEGDKLSAVLNPDVYEKMRSRTGR